MTWGTIINLVLGAGVAFLYWYKGKGTPAVSGGEGIEGILRLVADLLAKLPHDSVQKSNLADLFMSGLRDADQVELLRKLEGSKVGQILAARAAAENAKTSSS